MNAIDKLSLLAELGQAHCELNHGPGTKAEDWPAVDYIVLPFGYHESGIAEVSARELVIPVCGECRQALLEEEWTLLYCFECASSQWVYRPLAKNNYRHHILWLRGCPHCANEFGGLYFNDFNGLAGEVELVAGLAAKDAA